MTKTTPSQNTFQRVGDAVSPAGEDGTVTSEPIGDNPMRPRTLSAYERALF